MNARGPAWRQSGTGVSFHVRLTPKGGKDRVEGWIVGTDGNRFLKVRVAAPPERNKANDSLLALLARELHIPKTGIAIRSGQSHRLKTIVAEGDGDGLAARLAGFGEAN